MVFDNEGTLRPTDNPEHRFYVYVWICRSWGYVPFYVGKGTRQRYKQLQGRSIQFRALVERFDCFPMILLDNLSEEQAYLAEAETKRNLIAKGMPIIDAELREKRKMAQRTAIASMPVDENGKRVSTKTGGNFGPAKIVPPNFREVYERQQSGELTLKEALAEVGIGRTRWYELAREFAA